MVKKTKKKGGRPTRFCKSVQARLKKAYRAGLTDEEVAELMNLSVDTIDGWKRRHSEFFRAVKESKTDADSKVEASLYQRACGYTCPDTKAQWVQDDKGGRWEYAEYIKHYPPDPTSIIFWLKNRQPEKWRDKKDVEMDGNITIEIQKFADGDNKNTT